MFKLSAPTLRLLTQAIGAFLFLISFEPYAATPERNVYFGDLHVHTSWSYDASAFQVTTTPDDAYRYALGQAIPHAGGTSIQIDRPLDFMAVTDHAEYLGMVNQLKNPDSPLSKTPLAKRFAADLSAAYLDLDRSTKENKPFPELEDDTLRHTIWQKVVENANQYNDPGKFTTFIGFEWTANAPISRIPFTRNMHRNIIYRDDKAPALPFTSFDSLKPESLWRWMEARRNDGQELLAIPHNGNLSDGSMYSLTNSAGKPMSKEYSETRKRNEPVSEVIQTKGQSMTHPSLSSSDEFANFETYRDLMGDVTEAEPQKLSKVSGSYVRQAQKNGLQIHREIGINPFEFGFIGSSDNHNGAAGPDEEKQFYGTMGLLDATAEQRLYPKSKILQNLARFGSGGLTAIWSEENTRSSLFDAIMRKEVYATSGPRLKLRVFGGFNFSANQAENTWARDGYQNGVPMGGVLSWEGIAEANTQLRLLITAQKDPQGANLDRAQVIKGWVDASGETHEKIYNVALSDNRTANNEGEVNAIGNTVDLKTATYTNSIGASNLSANWQDPDFDASQSAFYYVRLLEIPTPRWTTIQSVQLGRELRKDVPTTIQERAWSSPIWYHAKPMPPEVNDESIIKEEPEIINEEPADH